MRRRGLTLVLGCMLTVSACIQAWQAWACSPLYDETAHLASGLATLRIGDFGYYRVNPPFHKVWSAIFVEMVWRPELPGLMPAALTGPGTRKEFELGRGLVDANQDNYRCILLTARLARVPIVLLGGWFIFVTVNKFRDQQSGLIGAALWLSSPLVLGHGWALLADTCSGVAMSALVLASLSWLENRSKKSSLLVGLAWGAAMSTKFTFCPLYVLWPVSIASYQICRSSLIGRDTTRLLIGHVAQGVVALVVVWAAYGFDDVGVPLEDHRLESRMFRWLNPVNTHPLPGDDVTQSRWKAVARAIGKIPSPFPRQFLVGIDAQRIDCDRVYPTYILGSWFESGPWWYYLVGYGIKEQLAVLLGIALVPYGLYRMRQTGGSQLQREPGPRNTTVPYVSFLVAGAGCILLVLSCHTNLALNVRYIFPLLPLIYVTVGLTLPTMHVGCGMCRRLDVGKCAMAALICTEVSCVCPHFFAYTNPAFGGMYRVPPALHDSNFDWGQDIWALERWFEKRTGHGERSPKIVCMHSQVGQLLFDFALPSDELLKEAIEQRASDGEASSRDYREVVILRGLGVPAAWTLLVTPDGEEVIPSGLIGELLKYEPDEFITPTIALYRVYDSSTK